MSALDVCVITLLAPRLSNGDNRVDVVRPTRYVISARQAARMVVVLKKSDTRDA